MLSRLLGIACPCILLASTQPAPAASHWAFCNEYANQAVISASMNMSHGCGFTGSRWGLDYRVHFNWCMSASNDDAMSERMLRKQGIQACHGGATHNGQW